MEETAVITERQRLVAFKWGNEQYGVDINRILEIIPLQPITKVPGVPDYLEGITNLRGKVITVLDLRVQLGLEATPPTPTTCIVIIDHQGESLGLIVDDVSEVLQVEEKDVDHPSRLASGLEAAYVQGVAKVGDDLLVVLDLESVLRGFDQGRAGTTSP